MGLVYGHATDTRGWASILAAASTTRCTARSLDPLVPKRAVTMEVVAARAGAVAVEVHADRPAGGAPRARAGLVVERREVGFLDGGRHGAPVRHPDAVEVADACYWEPRPVALQRRTALGQWYDARSAAWIDIQRRRAPEDHGRGRRGRRDAVPPQRASPSCSTMGTLSSSTSGMSGALVNGRQQQASAEAAKRSTLLSA